jgi:hypothetical protein
MMISRMDRLRIANSRSFLAIDAYATETSKVILFLVRHPRTVLEGIQVPKGLWIPARHMRE